MFDLFDELEGLLAIYACENMVVNFRKLLLFRVVGMLI